MDEEQAKKLREPFKAEQIGKLPKVNCKACTDANKARFGTTCDRHQKAKCPVCENYMTTGHIHLDYVGHAAATDRLLQVDPEWTWEPAAVDQYGMPLVSGDGLWIKLTIAGVTRYGFGDGKNVKEMIGDAIRNAAMRFGVALDLWAKEDLQHDDSPATAAKSGEAAEAPAGVAPAAPAGVPPTESEVPPSRLQRARIRIGKLEARGIDVDAECAKRVLPPLDPAMDLAEFDLFCVMLDELENSAETFIHSETTEAHA